MLVVRNRKRDRKNADSRKKTSGRGALVRRGVFFTLIAGLLGFFIYNNVDYFVALGEKAVPGLRAMANADRKPKPPENQKAPAKPKARKSMEEILGGPEFTDNDGSGRGMEVVPLNGWILEARAGSGVDKKADNGVNSEIVDLVDGGTAAKPPTEDADMASAPLPGLHTADLTRPIDEPKPDSPAAGTDADLPRPLAMRPISLTRAEPEPSAVKKPKKAASVEEWLSSIEWPSISPVLLTSLTSLIPWKSSPKTPRQAQIEEDSVSQPEIARTGAVDTAAGQSAGKKVIPPVDKKADRLVDTKTSQPVDKKTDRLVDTKTSEPVVDTKANRLVDTKANQTVDTKVSQADDAKTSKPVDTKTVKPVEAKTASQPVSPKAKQNSIFLSDIRCKLAGRDDLSISMSIQLFYDDNGALSDELHFKRGTLAVVTGDVLRGYEYGGVEMASLSADLLSTFNGLLNAGQLSGVEIKNFRVEQIAARTN